MPYVYTYTYTHKQTNKHTHIAGPSGCDGLRHEFAASRLLRLGVRIPPEAWMFFCCVCCVLSGRGLCDGLNTHPQESYRMWCVVVCDRTRRSWSALGRNAIKKWTYYCCRQFISISHKKLLANLHTEKLRVLISTLCLEAGNGIWWGIRRQHLRIPSCFDRK